MQTVIQAQSISKFYGLKKVIKQVSFSACEQETIAVMGANGAGKTTLLNILATLLSPDEGKVDFFGLPLKGNEPEVRRRLGLVGHASMVYADLSLEENLRFYANLYSVPNPQHRVTQMLEQVDLVDKRRQVVRTLSRGMQQRLAISRALLHDPMLLLLDEPFTGLDQSVSEKMQTLLKNITAEKKTIVMTSHRFQEVAALATHVLFLKNGRLIDSFELLGMDEQSLAERYRSIMQTGAE